ncbi:DUF1758 domain-containing protein [Trichonephila clavipes]|nr:DUF1758 domain-containing protein [Trichonephila clavipes]
MLSVPKIPNENPVQLRLLIDTVRSHLRSSKNLRMDSNLLSDAILLHLLHSKIDRESQRLFQLNLKRTEVPSLQDFFSFLEIRCIQLESIRKTDFGTKNFPEINRGGEVPKEAELTDFEMRFLEEPILTLPLSMPFDSDSTDIEISKPQYPSTSTSALLIPPVTPSQNTEKITEYDSSSDPSNAVMDMNDLKPTPKIARPLKETLAMFRKRAKTPTAPSAAARAAAYIEEHRMKIKYMEMDEWKRRKF